MRLLLRGGRIIDPSQHIDEKMDLLIENGKIVKVAKNIYKAKTAAEDKGREEKEEAGAS